MASNPGRPVPPTEMALRSVSDSLGILDRPATSAHSLASCSARSPSADPHSRPLEPFSTLFEAPGRGKR